MLVHVRTHCTFILIIPGGKTRGGHTFDHGHDFPRLRGSGGEGGNSV
jgi:hypothetical protein